MQRSPPIFSDRVAQFGLTKIWNDCVCSIVEILKQPLLMMAQLEIIIFFFAKLDVAPLRTELAVGAAFFVG